MRKRNIVRALVTYSKTDFFLVGRELKGIQVDLLREYERFLNKGIKKTLDKVRIKYIPVPFDALIPSLIEGRGDIAAAFLTITPEREKKVAFAAGKSKQVSELLVSNKSNSDIRRLEDLAGRRVYLLRGSSYVEHMQALSDQLASRGLPKIKIEEADQHLLSEDILELVNAGVVDMTVVDDYKARLWAQVLTNLVVHENIALKSDNSLGWAIRKENRRLQKSLSAFVEKVKPGTLLGNILFKRYFKNTRWIDNPITKAEREKLDKYIGLFKKYGKKYGFDALAIVAQAYQESGLDHGKKSHRGAIGIMQLLPSTARDPNVNIANIDSAENNIHAGTKYLAFLRDRYFSDPEIRPEDRFAFSWAAYNAGPAKVRKMRNLAKKMGLDQNQWFSNVEVAAGRLVGRETVKYVANIYKYYVAYVLIQGLLESKAAVANGG